MKNFVAIAAPSGSGKTTLCRELQKQNPEIEFSISVTTRPRRHYERDGYDYYFVSNETFEQMIQRGELLEYEEVHGYYYGTKKASLEETIKKDKVLLLDVDVKGALSIKKHFPDKTALVFILPPSVDALFERLKRRGTDSEERIQIRLRRLQMEMSFKEQFDYVIINDKLEDAVTSLKNIIISETKGVTNGN